MDLTQDLLMKIRRLEEKEEKTQQVLKEQMDNNKSLKRNMEELQKHVQEKDSKLSEANQVLEHCCGQQDGYFDFHCFQCCYWFCF